MRGGKKDKGERKASSHRNKQSEINGLDQRPEGVLNIAYDLIGHK
jgi:hypothetical protein